MKNYLLIVLLVLFPASCLAQQDPASTLKLAAPIADHMVLQHGKPTSVWGTAKPEAAITVDFAGQTIQATADANGQWKATLTPLSINAEPSALTVTATGGNKITVNDVLVGEVWMCSGQSNMQWTLAKTKDPAVKQADLPAVRLFTTVSKTSDSIQSDCDGDWELCTPQSAARFSAVGFHFGKELFETLNVPIGLVDTSWGGKKVEAFTSVDKLRTVPDALPLLLRWEDRADSYDPELAKAKYSSALKKWKAKRKKAIAANPEGQKPKLPRKPKPPVEPQLDTSYPGAIFNQKVAPWTNYAIAGSIWYQGEANAGRAAQYESLLTALIEDWRGRWGNEFPFYIVQLANFRTPTTEPGVANDWAELQAMQTKVAQTVPNSGVAVINDIGVANNIHPPNKKDVGHRLALLALKQHYDKDIDPFSSPLYRSHEIAGAHVLVTLEHVGTGLKSRDGKELKRFEIAGADRKWHWAKAEIVGKDSVGVSCSDVPAPVAVRYAWASNPAGANLVNSAGLPASIFRTDDWPLSTKGKLSLKTEYQKFAQRKD